MRTERQMTENAEHRPNGWDITAWCPWRRTGGRAEWKLSACREDKGSFRAEKPHSEGWARGDNGFRPKLVRHTMS
jgi:hypothetical protein